MGRIKTKQIKAVTAEAFEMYKEKFTIDFNENKQLLNQIQDGESKKLRNVIAGYATRLKKRDIKLGI